MPFKFHPRRSFAVKSMFLLAPLALASLPLFAGMAAGGSAAPWEGAAFTGDPAAVARAAARIQGEEGDDVVVLLMEASYSFDAAGRETYSQRLVYRILTAGAHESWSTVEEGWEPWHQARPEIRARVITPDGAEHLLDPATIAENSATRDAADMFEDGRVLRAPLPATRVGAVVEQQVTVRDTAPFFDGGVTRLHSLDPGMPLLHARLTLEAPAAMPLRWVARELPGVSPREEMVAGGRRRLTFEARDLEPADDPEPGLPAETPRSAYVAFSTGRSWADLARRYSEIVDRSIRGADIAPFLRAASAGAPGGVAAGDDQPHPRPDERRGPLHRHGARRGGLIPRTPAETLKRRFGDCKDKAVLLTALLRAADIPAYVALLNADESDQDVEESLPGFGLFNHAIVVVPGAPAIWIDPTDPYARAGELPVADQGRRALVASPTATSLVRTPEATAAENRQIETREVFLADLGPSRIVETSEYQGAIERDVRALYSLQDGQTVRQALKDYAATAYLAEDLSAVSHSNAADLSAPMRLRIEIKNARRGFTDERNAGVGILPAALLNRLPDELLPGDGEDASPEPRQADYVFSRPMTIEVRYRIVPPVGYTPQPLPAPRVRHLGPATLSEEYAAGDGNVVTATFRLDTGKRRISPRSSRPCARACARRSRTRSRSCSSTRPARLTSTPAGCARRWRSSSAWRRRRPARPSPARGSPAPCSPAAWAMPRARRRGGPSASNPSSPPPTASSAGSCSTTSSAAASDPASTAPAPSPPTARPGSSIPGTRSPAPIWRSSSSTTTTACATARGRTSAPRSTSTGRSRRTLRRRPSTTAC